MADMTDVKIRLNFWRSAYEKLTAAYTALVDGRTVDVDMGEEVAFVYMAGRRYRLRGNVLTEED